ncbi:DUF2599 domain-containing protein [Frigoribacterium sp. PhB24]|uniref:DUF2599 domain-containing protein n=1 Tax=Frigoribacterium sp. PhB24 TaxID=2485204 RepID=UPI000F46F767|nr:DUF2599 domain-containing protein [Frigoribacterium sp. PhB24]ROS49008.1 uncharacterized protein DUF2599 [Frigoribacterium sp. PhB24]
MMSTFIRQKRSARAGVVALTAALCAVGTLLIAGPAHADTPTTDDDSILQTIAAVAPDALQNIEPVSSSEVQVPDDPTSLISVPVDTPASLAGAVQIGVPFADDADTADTAAPGVQVYDNNNDSATVPITHDDGSVQILTVIDTADAPTRYDYSLTVPTGASAEHADGAVIITDVATQDFIAGIAPAWAKDATGAPVPTHYELHGTTLSQVIEHTPATAFPVTADPWIGTNLFSSIRTSSERGQPRYLLTRSAWGVAVSTGLAQGGGIAGTAAGQQIMLGAGWAEATSRNSGLKSKASLHQQYDCHVFYAFAKPDSWNLEKFRPNNSGWGRNPLTHKCNW